MGSSRSRLCSICEGGAIAALLMGLLLLVPTAAAVDEGPVDVCPANSVHKTLPFLEAIKPGALAGLLANGLSIDMTAVTDFIKTTLVPAIGANVFFFALAALLLIILIIWRLLRWCCVVCCCRGSCDLKRSKNDPGEILFGKRMKINKGFMWLFGLVAIAFAVYGLATVDKNVTDGAFNVLTSITTFATGAFDTLDHLLLTISGTTDIISDFQDVVTLDIEVDLIITNLTAIGTFLTVAPAPSVLLTSVTGLETRANVDLAAATSQLSTSLGAGPTSYNSNVTKTWTTYLPNIGAADPLFNTAGTGYKDLAADLQAAMLAINPAGGDPLPGDITTLQNAVNAMHTNMATEWVTNLDALVEALTYGVGANNPFSTVKAQAVLVKTISSDIVDTRVPALVTLINDLVAQYDLVSPKMSGLLVKLQYINDTILELPAAMSDAYTSLYDAKSNMDTAMSANPSPAILGTQLTTFRTTNFPPPSDLDALINDLTTIENNLIFNAGAGFPLATTQAYLAWLATTRAAVAAMVETDRDNGRFATFRTAINAYTTGYAASVGSAHTALLPYINAVAGGTAFGAVPASVNTYATRATVLAAAPQPTANTASASTFLADTTTALTPPNALSRMTATLKPNLQSVNTAYTALGSPPSQVVTEPTNQLQTIKDSAMTSGNSVKGQITSTVASFQGSTGSLKSMVVTQIDDIKAKYQEPAKTYDGYRYIASMALYGISILFVTLVLAASMANYQFGTNLSTLLLLVITILYFLLALIIALLIAALYMGCNELEPMAVKLAPAQFTPLLKYYFWNEGDSVSAVLKDANLVDIDAVKGQVQSSKTDVVSGLTGTFVWRDVPTNPRNPYQLIRRINDTIDTALVDVDTLITKASRPEMFKMYSEVKGYLCCSVPDMLSPMWTGLTMAGVFAVVLIIATFFYLSKLDHAPRKDCCGCTCHTRSRYAGSMLVGGEALPQYATPGWEQTPQYVPPNGAMAMHVPWIAGEHGTVNVMVAPVGGGKPKSR